MSLASITDARLAEWTGVLRAFGWGCDLRFADRRRGHVRVRGLRGGGTPVTLDVHEQWAPGCDPDGLALEGHGCHLRHSAWHAQFPGVPPLPTPTGSTSPGARSAR